VPSEHVAAIREGEVELDLHADDVARLEPYRELVSEPLEALASKSEDESAEESPPRRRSFFDRLFRLP
jgi:hypothetical protein